MKKMPVCVSKRDIVKIEDLFRYFKDIEEIETLSVKGLLHYEARADEFARVFFKYNPNMRDRVGIELSEISHLVITEIDYRHTDNLCSKEKTRQVKTNARKLVKEMNRHFGYVFQERKRRETDLKDAQHILFMGNKATFIEAAGLVAAKHLKETLIELNPKFAKKKPKNDNIMNLYKDLRLHSGNHDLVHFLSRKRSHFETARVVRSRVAHVNKGTITRDQVELVIGLAQQLDRYL